MRAKMQLQDGKVKWENSKSRLVTKNCWESMENQLNSSGICSRTDIIGDPPEDPKRLAMSKH